MNGFWLDPELSAQHRGSTWYTGAGWHDSGSRFTRRTYGQIPHLLSLMGFQFLFWVELGEQTGTSKESMV